jgi:DDE family transposase
MTISVQSLAAALQTLLTTIADKAAKDSGFVRRARKITGAGFVQSLVLGWMADPRAKLEDLAAPLGVADQSLQERFNARAADCLLRVLAAAMGYLFEARPETIPLLRRFTAVALDDSTTVALPASLADDYPGCGGSDPDAGRAGLKVMTRLEAIAGRLEFSEPAPAVTSDRTLHATLPPLPRGSLRLADLGFFDLGRMAADTAAGVSWISRAPAVLRVRRGDEAGANLPEWLGRQGTDRIDAIVTVGTKTRLTCRLVAVRAPEDVVARRLERLEKKQRKKGRRVSAAQRMLCEWTVMLTDLTDAGRYTAEQLWVLYRVRWQVELLYKRWKSGGGLGQSRGRTAHRVLCESLAKLLAALIQHRGTLLRGGPLCVVSATRAASRVRWWAGRLAEAVGSGALEAVVRVLERLKADLDRLPKRPKRAKKTTRQSLFAPSFTLS